ncbi:spinster family MFS transporter, partial [Marinobacter salarius]|uniref:spinster family MFS transporter n=1 Tax=Marinobacter salarius TaxID=1420917 RepID=UPI0032EBC867
HGFAFAIFYTLAGIPIGYLADRGDRRLIITAGLAAWSAMTVACGLARNFWQFFAARVGVGVGEAALSPAAYSLITDLVPRRQVGRALGAYGAGVYIGIGATFIFGGWLVDKLVASGGLTWWWLASLLPWQQIMILVGLPGLILAVAIFLLLPEPRKGIATTGQGPALDAPRLTQYLRDNWQFIASLFAGFAFVSLLFNGYVAWMAEYFLRTHDWSKAYTGFWLGIIMLVCGPLGMAAGGWATDWLARERPTTASLHVAMWGAVALLPWPPMATLVDSAELSAMLIAPIVFFSCFCFGPAIVALQMTTPVRLRAQLSALYLFVVNISGIGFGGTAIALVSDKILLDEARIGEAMAIVGSVSIVLAVIFLATARRLKLEQRGNAVAAERLSST